MWFSFRNIQGPTSELHAVEFFDSSLCFAIFRHFNKAKAFAAASFAIHDHVSRINTSHLREKIIQLTTELPEPPAIPEAARQLFVLASSQIKQASTPQTLVQPIGLLRKALEISPCWGNAYFNLSRALEMNGQYDEAARQLNYYLELKPSEADASEARAHLTVIQTEKETAGGKQ